MPRLVRSWMLLTKRVAEDEEKESPVAILPELNRLVGGADQRLVETATSGAGQFEGDS
uniref:hypothetical protein n=1 Tax=Trichocoleus desertorum TaxID=1481672 RepID=UPI0025B6206F|nr:hypothetical protein [Trichocoleus desertorum]